LRAATDRLAAAGIDTARLDAEVLLAHALGSAARPVRAPAGRDGGRGTVRYVRRASPAP
jgi:hypothetical protein